MPVLVRALLNGFGWKLGFEVGKYVARRMGITQEGPTPNREPETLENGEFRGDDGPGAG